MKDEGFNLTDPTFLKDYKMLSEALNSLLYRQVHMGHQLQKRVDKAITTRGKGKDLYMPLQLTMTSFKNSIKNQDISYYWQRYDL